MFEPIIEEKFEDSEILLKEASEYNVES